jgi:hypothetical protein
VSVAALSINGGRMLRARRVMDMISLLGGWPTVDPPHRDRFAGAATRAILSRGSEAVQILERVDHHAGADR